MNVLIKNSVIQDFIAKFGGEATDKNKKLIKYLALIGLDQVMELTKLSKNEAVKLIKKRARNKNLKKFY